MKSDLIAFDPQVEKLSNQTPEMGRTPVDIRNRERVKNETERSDRSVSGESSPARVDSTRSPVLSFKVDEDSGRTYIIVKDPVSGEIIRQVPPEEARRLSDSFEQLRGNTVDALA